MSAIDWNEKLAPTNGDPDLMASVFNSVISSLLEVHAPLKRRKITSHHALWITVEIKNLMKECDLAKKRSEKDASYWSESTSTRKKLRNKVTSELRARVQEYFYNLIDETQNNPKAMWKTINKVLHQDSNHTVTQNIIFEGTELKSAS